LVIIWAASASVQEHGLSVKVKRVETWSGWKTGIEGGLLECSGAFVEFSVHKDTHP
jgi:hypothetical protein